MLVLLRQGSYACHPATDLFPDAAYRGVAERPRPSVKVLAATSKFDGDAIDLHGIEQATSGWLTDQKRKLTFYEVANAKGNANGAFGSDYTFLFQKAR